MRMAVRASLVVIGALIIVLAVISAVDAFDGDAADRARAVIRAVGLGAVGAVFARAGIRYDAA